MKRFIFSLVAIKISVAILYSFIGFSLPHVVRQNVTLAVSQRFMIDWQFHNKSYSYLPRSLAGGDKDAILEMEFPLLNYITAPAFLLETNTARTVARLIYLFLVTGLWYLNYRTWKEIKILGISCEIPSLLLILTPISGMYFHRFMPDFLSFILCSLALGISLREPKKIFWPFLLATLGLLEKPTAIVAFGPLLLMPEQITQIRKRLPWLVPMTTVMFVYYVFGIKWIRSLSDLDRYYLTDFRNPIKSVVDFFFQPLRATKLFVEQINIPFLPVLTLGLWASNRFSKVKESSFFLWTLLGVQFLAIILMDGEHSFIHAYYYVGLSMTPVLLWAYYYEMSSSRFWKILLCAPILLFNMEHGLYELQDLVTTRSNSTHAYWQSCDRLKSKHPEWPWHQGKSFRSEITSISEISLCFGEIQSSTTSAYGFYMQGQQIPKDCHQIDQDGQIILVTCSQFL
jgi:hypothetical protein